jgi:hypothetical protein
MTSTELQGSPNTKHVLDVDILQYGARTTHHIWYPTPTPYSANHLTPWHEAITLTLLKFVVNSISGSVSGIPPKDLCVLTSVFVRDSACLQ